MSKPKLTASDDIFEHLTSAFNTYQKESNRKTEAQNKRSEATYRELSANAPRASLTLLAALHHVDFMAHQMAHASLMLDGALFNILDVWEMGLDNKETKLAVDRFLPVVDLCLTDRRRTYEAVLNAIFLTTETLLLQKNSQKSGHIPNDS